MGVHHAREWPSGEHAIEWAFELVNGYKSGDARAAGFVQRVRTIVIPIVNPDGFNISREAGERRAAATARRHPARTPRRIIVAPRTSTSARTAACRRRDSGTCAAARGRPRIDRASTRTATTAGSGAGRARAATSRNETYHGPGPFSEPETQNIRELVSRRQVTTLITNHTFSDLVLRAPGLSHRASPPTRPR